MTHVEIRRFLADGIVKMLAPGGLHITLRDYQRETLEATVKWLRRPEAPRCAYIAQATGLGKTVQYATITKAATGLRVLVIVPSKQLVEQSIRDLADFTEGTTAHSSSLKAITADNGDVLATHWKGQRHDILVTTDDTLKGRFELIKSEHDPHVIVWDECHWAYTERAQRALAAFPEAVVIGFSATPDYLTTTAKKAYVPVTLDNGQTLYCPPNKLARNFFPELLDERTVRWGIQNAHLAPLAWGQLDYKLQLDGITVVDGPGGPDYDQAELQETMSKNWEFVIQTICKLYVSGQYNLAERFSAAVCPGVAHAESLAEALRGIGLQAESITQKTKDAARTDILKRGRDGKLQFVSSVFALREGWNSPNLEVAMMLRPTKSRVLYMQFMGRALRLLGDKVALVLDPHYQQDAFAPLSAPVLFGTPGQAVYSGGILVGRSKGDTISPYLLDKLEPVLTIQPIQIEYCAGEDGTFTADGEVWAGVGSAALLLGLSRPTVLRHAGKCRTREGKDQSNRVQTFLALSDVKMACADLLRGLPQAGKDGTFTADGEVWATAGSAAQLLGLARLTVSDRSGECRTREGKDQTRRDRTFYALSDVKTACADLLQELPQAGKDGTFTADGEVWATEKSATRLLGLNQVTIASRARKCRTREGKDQSNRVQTFLALSDVKTACADLLQELPQAGKDGTFTADGEVWTTAGSGARVLGLSSPTRVSDRSGECRTREGKDQTGRIQAFFALSDLREACRDLLERKKKKTK